MIDGTLRWINLRASHSNISNGSNQSSFTGEEGSDARYFGNGANPGVSLGGTTYAIGWVRGGGLADVATRDRVSSGDARLAGMHFVAQNSAGFADLRLTLDAPGTYEIHTAIGDQAGDHANQYVAIYDTTTLKATAIDSAANHVADNFYDATGANLSRAAWPGSEVGVSVVMATTQLNIRVGKAAFASEAVCLAAIGIKLVNTNVDGVSRANVGLNPAVVSASKAISAVA